MKIQRIFFIFLVLSTAGCVHIENIKTNKIETPFKTVAIRNYLPESVRVQPAYTIYDGSEWFCDQATSSGDSVCCLKSFGSMTPWKYCLLVDKNGSGFGFFEPGVNQALMWPEGKQILFQPIK